MKILKEKKIAGDEVELDLLVTFKTESHETNDINLITKRLKALFDKPCCNKNNGKWCRCGNWESRVCIADIEQPGCNLFSVIVCKSHRI